MSVITSSLSTIRHIRGRAPGRRRLPDDSASADPGDGVDREGQGDDDTQDAPRALGIPARRHAELVTGAEAELIERVAAGERVLQRLPAPDHILAALDTHAARLCARAEAPRLYENVCEG